MPMAFVMMNVKVGTDVEVVRQISLIKGVTGVFEVYSIYDIVVEVKTGTMVELEDIVTTRIRRLENVLNTHTMIVAEGLSQNSGGQTGSKDSILPGRSSSATPAPS